MEYKVYNRDFVLLDFTVEAPTPEEALLKAKQKKIFAPSVAPVTQEAREPAYRPNWGRK